MDRVRTTSRVRKANIDDQIRSILAEIENEDDDTETAVEEPMLDEDMDDDLNMAEDDDSSDEITDEELEACLKAAEEDESSEEVPTVEEAEEDEDDETTEASEKKALLKDIKSIEAILSEEDEDSSEEVPTVEEAEDDDLEPMEPEEEDQNEEVTNMVSETGEDIENQAEGGDPSVSVEFPQYADESAGSMKQFISKKREAHVRNILRRLNRVAAVLEKSGDKRHAFEVDSVADEFEKRTGIKERSY